MQDETSHPTDDGDYAADGAYEQWIVFVALGTVILLSAACAFGRTFWVAPIFDPASFRLDENTKTIIIGASRSDASFDTDQISNCRSLSRNAEPIFFTYHKLRHLLGNNPGIKNVILATGPVHISTCQDRYLFGSNSASRQSHMAYYPFLNEEGKRQIRRFSEDYITASVRFDYGLPLGYMNDLKKVTNHYRGRYVASDFECWHGQGPIDEQSHVSLSHIQKKIQFYFYKDGKLGDVSQLAIEHHENIATLCESHGVRLWMVKTPLHPDFRKLIPKECFHIHSNLVQKLAEANEHVELLDYTTLPLDSSLFLDGDHLNSDGAMQFTTAFVRDLNRQLAFQER